MIMPLVLLGVGLALLIVGGEWLVAGAARLAARLGMSALVIGLTVVAFGTSAPELVVTLDAGWRGGDAANLALGNVVGSNIFNVLFILGACALITPLVVNLRIVRIEAPIMIAASAALLWFTRDGLLGRTEGALLFASLLVYVAFTLWQAPRADTTPGHTPVTGLTGTLLRVLAGLVLLVVGARILVTGAVQIAAQIGLSETVIGLTIVAAGTSLPEVAASIIATVRGQRDMAVGNVIGSNIFNILAVAGLAAIVAPSGLPAPTALSTVDGPIMLAVAVACLPIFFTGHRIARWEGAIFLGYYIAYVSWLLLDAAGHDAAGAFSTTMLLFVVPLTLLTLAISLWRAWREHGKQTAL